MPTTNEWSSAPASDLQSPSMLAGPRDGAAIGGQHTVLIVDDDPDILALAALHLGQSGYRVVPASDGAEALDLYGAERPDIVLVDLCMPGLDGFEIVAEIRRREPDALVPVLMLTAVGAAVAAEKAFAAGATDFIPKPLDPVLLDQRMRCALRNSGLARELREHRDRLRHAQTLARLGSWQFMARANLFDGSDELLEIFGLRRDTPMTLERVSAMVHPDDIDRVRQRLVAMFRKPAIGAVRDLEFRIVRDDRQVRVLNLLAEPARNKRGMVYGLFGVVQDVTERKRIEERLAYLDQYDPLTGLPNRLLFRDRLHQAMLDVRVRGDLIGLLAVDFAGLATVERAVGRQASEDFIREASERLKACVGESATVSHRGGTQFLVLLPAVGQVRKVGRVAESILVGFNTEVTAGGNSAVLAPNIGIAVHSPRSEGVVDDLIQAAMVAMQRSESHGGRAYRFFKQDMHDETVTRFRLESDLRQAMDRGEFSLRFQPQILAATGQAHGAEVLLRWNQDGHRRVPPDAFVPILEDTGLIIPVGAWLLREACRQIQDFDPAGGSELTIAVNLSARQLDDQALAEMVGGVLTETGLPPHRLELEITEHHLMANMDKAVRTLRTLRRLGVNIAIDDFGTGYSSLSYLRDLPIDSIKIDGSFIRGVSGDTVNAAIVGSTVGLAHSLGLRVVAEGVEQEADFEFLRQAGCDVIQGFLTGRPLDAAAFRQWLNRTVIPGDAADGVNLARR
jgi:diguanylate cyclase (GGDEF)-like protein/PAS domain S-box-containing protein